MRIDTFDSSGSKSGEDSVVEICIDFGGIDVFDAFSTFHKMFHWLVFSVAAVALLSGGGSIFAEANTEMRLYKRKMRKRNVKAGLISSVLLGLVVLGVMAGSYHKGRKSGIQDGYLRAKASLAPPEPGTNGENADPPPDAYGATGTQYGGVPVQTKVV